MSLSWKKSDVCWHCGTARSFDNEGEALLHDIALIVSRLSTAYLEWFFGSSSQPQTIQEQPQDNHIGDLGADCWKAALRSASSQSIGNFHAPQDASPVTKERRSQYSNEQREFHWTISCQHSPGRSAKVDSPTRTLASKTKSHPARQRYILAYCNALLSASTTYRVPPKRHSSQLQRGIGASMRNELI